MTSPAVGYSPSVQSETATPAALVFDVAGVPTRVSDTNPLPVSGGGGGGGGGAGFADMPFIDALGQQFFFQDNGTSLTGYKIQAGARSAYTPTAPWNLASGGLTDTQLRASAVPVAISSIVEVEVKNDAGNPLSVTGGLTDTQLRANPVPTILSALNYIASTLNSSTVQLAPGASFPGSPETILNQQAAQVEIVCDQPYMVQVIQYIDSAGTLLSSVDTFYKSGGQPLNENITLPGNYFKIVVTNLGTATTQGFRLDTTFGIMATGPRSLGQADRSESLPVVVADSVLQVAPDYINPAQLQNVFDVTGVAASDILLFERASNGQGFLALSSDPLADAQTSTLILRQDFTIPNRMEFELGMSQRVKGNYGAFDVYSNDPGGPAASSAISMSSIQQAATTLTVILGSAYPGDLGDWVSIYGVTSDNRLNYPNLVVASIDAAKTTLTFTTADDVALPSLTVGPFTSQGFLQKDDQLSGSQNGFRLRFSGVTAAAAAFLSKLQGGSMMASGTFTGVQTATVGTTANVYTSMGNGYGEIKPTTRYLVVNEPETLTLSDRTIDNAGVSYTARLQRTNVKPTLQHRYQARLRLTNARSIPRPVAKIVSAVKPSATTTATITTAAAHGLAIGQYVTLVGIRDQTNFANMATAGIILGTNFSTTTFDIAIGTAAIATSYGGLVSLANGALTQPGLSPQTISTAARAANGDVTLVSGATWTGVQIGDYVNVYGCRVDTTGADFTIDGAYKVKNLATTTLLLSPLSDYTGTNRSPTNTGALTVTNCGGAVIERNTVRLHDLRVEQYGQLEARIAGQGTTRLDLALPTQIVNTPAVTVSSGTVTSITNALPAGTNAIGSVGNTLPTSVADVASAALTTTTTTAALTPTFGSGYEINIPVTVVTGTTPTLDVDVEESDDGGTNWFRVYSFPRITATGMYRSPKLALTGNRVRYVQTVGGATPSFTRAVNRLQNSDGFVPFRQSIDRAVAPNTLNATTATMRTNNSSNLQLVVNMGAGQTTAPVFQLEGSDDNGASWYSIGTAVTGVVSATASSTFANVHADLVRARVSTAGVAATLGANGVLIKAFGA